MGTTTTRGMNPERSEGDSDNEGAPEQSREKNMNDLIRDQIANRNRGVRLQLRLWPDNRRDEDDQDEREDEDEA